jgi:hypothetical protein
VSKLYNIYCDESCHLENDRQPIMALGAVLCPHLEASQLAAEIREYKMRYRATGELKWTKVSNSRLQFYLELVDWFFKEQSIHFRALIVQNKKYLDHDAFNQGSHDTFYYKMYFSLLNKMLDPESQYNIYLDVKDTRSRRKLQKLHEVLCNNVHDFTSHMIHHIQNIHSYESDLMQLTDLLLGAVSYRNRSLSGNEAKEKIIESIENKINRSLKYSTPLREEKFNLFIFTPRES